MLNEKQLIQISKFLSLVLRHQPELIGIHLDANGWTNADTLIERSARHGVKFDKEILKHIVETNSKKRFAFSPDGSMIRASQGHSVEVDLGYVKQQPPEILYHGTGENSVHSILQTGLEKRSRQHVHLSSDMETALKVGQRHGKPFIFIVNAGKMHADELTFFLSDNGVWLTDHVPAKYLKAQDH